MSERLTAEERHDGLVMGLAIGQQGAWYSEAAVENLLAARAQAHPAPDCRYPCGCDQFADEHCTCMDGHAAHPAPVETREFKAEALAAAALELVREWTQIDGRLVLTGRDLADFRDQLADAISGRES